MRSVGPVNAVQLGTLIKVIAFMHDVPQARLPALKGRFGNFLKLGMPPVRAVGTGSRAEYWPTHVAQTLVAFELVRLRMPQTAAARCVTVSLEAVEEAFGEAARQLSGDRPGGSTVLTVLSNALLEDAKRPEYGDLSLALTTSEPGATARQEGCVLALDAKGLIERAAQAAARTDEPFGTAFFTTLGCD